MQFAWGYAPTLCIEAAVRHGIFDLLDKGPRTVQQLARQTGASVRGLTAILNVLVALKLLARRGGRYVLTPESAVFLVSSKPGYYGMFFNHISDQLLPRWLELSEIVRTGAMMYQKLFLKKIAPRPNAKLIMMPQLSPASGARPRK